MILCSPPQPGRDSGPADGFEINHAIVVQLLLAAAAVLAVVLLLALVQRRRPSARWAIPAAGVRRC